MRLVVNGSEAEFDDPATIDDLVEQVAPDRRRRGTAVALNGEVIPKSAWSTKKLSDGDRIEVLHAVGGG